MILILKSVLMLCLFTQIGYGFELLKCIEYPNIVIKKNQKAQLVQIGFCLIITYLIHWVLGLALYFLIFTFRRWLIGNKVKKKKQIIEFNGYKIFKFLLNQISSGILVSDAIKSMYRIVEDPELRQCLIDVSAYYSKTSDLIKSLEILKRQYKSMEVDTLCIAIEQGIYTGTNYETLKRMEALLFKRYIYQIKLETKWRKKKSILSVILLCTVMILMIAIPVVMDMMKAFNQIFII
ncbi:MAG: type II secretion system F family protein [Clostridiales bacterium]|nr:type II secretion system F family protein [Clostridiales bacterium]